MEKIYGVLSYVAQDVIDVDMNNYYTKEETKEQIQQAIVGGDVVLDDYAKKEYVDQAVENIDLSNFATKEEIPNKTSQLTNDNGFITNQDLVGLAKNEDIPTKNSQLTNDSGFVNSEYVNQKIAEAQVGGEVDLSAYYTKTQTDNKISTSLTPYAKKADLSTVAISGEYDDLRNKPTIPTVPTKLSQFTNDAGFITANDIPAVDIPDVDLTNYYTKNETDQKIAEAQLGGEVDLTNYYTKGETNSQIENAVGAIKIPDVSNMATKDEIPSIEGLAKTADLATVATSGSYNDLIDLPTGSISIGSEPDGDAQIWIDTSGGDVIDFADVAFTGSYTNLINTPDLSVYQTEAMVLALINQQLGVIENGTY